MSAGARPTWGSRPARGLQVGPGRLSGYIADASQVIRVLLTGSRQSPNLPEVTAALGSDEVLRRARAVLAGQ